MRLAMAHANGGSAPQVGNPIHLSATPVEYPKAPPTLGEDTAAVWRELAHSDAQITALRQAGIV